MTTSPAIKRLGNALRSITDNGDPGKVVALAREFGIEGRLARRAAQNIEVNVSAYMRLCAAACIDPVTGKIVHCEDIDRWAAATADVDPRRLAIKILTLLIHSDKSMRQLAKKWGVSTTALARAKVEAPVNVDNFLRICKGLKCQPHEFTKRTPEMSHVKQPAAQVEQI